MAETVGEVGGALVPALANVEKINKSEAAQRTQAREALESERKQQDALLQRANEIAEAQRIRKVEEHKQDAFVTADQKPTVVPLTAREVYLQQAEAREKRIAELAAKLSSREVAATESEAVYDEETGEWIDVDAGKKSYVFNEAGELVGGENLTTEDYDQAEADLAELKRLQEDQAQAEAECGSHWYCSGCELLGKDWFDVGGLTDKVAKALRLDGLLESIKNGSQSAFNRFLKCVHQMGESKNAKLVTAVAAASNQGSPGMMNAALNEMPIANKNEIFKRDAFNCGTRMLQDPTTVSSYTNMLDKMNMPQDAILKTQVPGLGVAGTDLTKVTQMSANGNRFVRSSMTGAGIPSDRFERTTAILENETMRQIVRA